MEDEVNSAPLLSVTCQLSGPRDGDTVSVSNSTTSSTQTTFTFAGTSLWSEYLLPPIQNKKKVAFWWRFYGERDGRHACRVEQCSTTFKYGTSPHVKRTHLARHHPKLLAPDSTSGPGTIGSGFEVSPGFATSSLTTAASKELQASTHR